MFWGDTRFWKCIGRVDIFILVCMYWTSVLFIIHADTTNKASTLYWEGSNMLQIRITFRYLFIHQNPSSLQHIFSIAMVKFCDSFLHMKMTWKESVTPSRETGWRKIYFFSLKLYCEADKDVYLHPTLLRIDVTRLAIAAFHVISCW